MKALGILIGALFFYSMVAIGSLTVVYGAIRFIHWAWYN